MEITTNAIQTVNTAGDVLFTETIIPGSSSIMHRPGSGLVTLRGMCCGQPRARFRISFNGNIAVPTGETVGAVSLAISLCGEAIPVTTMITTPAAVNEYFNVSASTFIDVHSGCCVKAAIKNTSTIPVSVQNANLIVERVA